MKAAEVLFRKALYDLADLALSGVLVHRLLLEAKKFRQVNLQGGRYFDAGSKDGFCRLRSIAFEAFTIRHCIIL